MPIDWFTVVAQILNFIILVWILKRFLYKPILKAMEDRKSHILETIANADEEKRNAENERIAYEAKNEEITRTRGEMLHRAQSDASKERERLLAEARTESEVIRQQFQEALVREKDSIQSRLTQRAEQEVFEITRKLLDELSDSELQERMSRKFLHLLQNLGNDARESLRAALDQSTNRLAIIRSAFELAPESRDALQHFISEWLGGCPIQFEVRNSLGCGIELGVDGQKVSWSIEDYLQSLQSSVNALLTNTEDSHAKDR